MGTITPFFDGLDDEDRKRVLAACKHKVYEKGDFIFHQGEAGGSLHIILRGRVAVIAGGGRGEELIVAVMRAGEAFGEQALLSADDRRTATIQAITETTTMSLHRDDFEDLRRRHPSINDVVIRILALRVDRLTQQLVEIVEVPPKMRFYRKVLLIADVFDLLDSPLPIPVTQLQMARLTGVKERVTQQYIQEARKDGVLDTAKSKLSVLNWLEVRRRAGLRAA